MRATTHCARCKVEPKHPSYGSYCHACGQKYGRAHQAKRRDQERRRPDAHRRAFARDLHERYDLDVETFARMFDAQGCACRICLRPLTLGRNVHVDHCHKSRRVRGILCNRCNLMIGLAHDDPRVLRAAAAYLWFNR